MIAYTDYPFEILGDHPGREAPIRKVDVVAYDGDKYCTVIVCGRLMEVKRGYLYEAHGRLKEVPAVKLSKLRELLTA